MKRRGFLASLFAFVLAPFTRRPSVVFDDGTLKMPPGSLAQLIASGPGPMVITRAMYDPANRHVWYWYPR